MTNVPPESSLRVPMLDVLSLLASPEAQLEYESDVPHVYVPDEMICSFADDQYLPRSPRFVAAFSQLERERLAELSQAIRRASDRLKSTSGVRVVDLLQLPEWQAVVSCAKRAMAEIQP